MGVYFCQLCRRTFFSGKGHVYEKKHKEKLKTVLTKFRRKVEAAFKMMKEPQAVKYDYIEHEKNFWCYCCGCEVRKHMSSENITVLYGALLEHLASPEHRKQTNKFWWENRAEAGLKAKFLISIEDYERFKALVGKTLECYEEKEDELIKQEAVFIREMDQKRQEIIQSVLEPQAEQDAQNGFSESDVVTFDKRPCIATCTTAQTEQPGSNVWEKELDSGWTPAGPSLSFIGHKQEETGKGNVHTGATPPWLIDDDDDDEESGNMHEIGPSYEEFAKHREKEKLKKLPAHRVGANFDHTTQTDEMWLPSFGRVWNNGRRWQSRHQFRAEENKSTMKRSKSHQWKNKKVKLEKM
ncbi:centrosomal AT-AC splicing factor isoform X1 [Protopterus annectens]|uniref:centrosomal AT-AC splicing factor isoform X1 n=1 Tax=Protopterus annectens TaxID=7888 RepID=UPI001CFA1A00|nr:centrosomal AT-AC splicing factor isoform X1 [Protopterus annectens]